MAITTLDPSKRLDIKYRQGFDGAKTITFLDGNGDAYSLTGLTFALNIRRKETDTSNVLQLTSGSGLTINASSIDVAITDTQTTAFNGDYYWELTVTDAGALIKIWLNGYLQETGAGFDGVL